MTLANAISTFAWRGRRGASWTFVAWSGLLAGVLYGIGAWMAAERQDAPTLADSFARVDILALLTLALLGFVVAPAMVAAAVSGERRAGTLDQLRTTALSPLGLALGFVLGVPARLYLLGVGPLALHLAAAAAGAIPWWTVPAALGLVAAGSFASAALGLLVALSPRQEAGAGFVAMLVAGGLGLFAVVCVLFQSESEATGWTFLHPAGGLSAVMVGARTLWRTVVLPAYRVSGEDVPALAVAPLASVAASLLTAGLALRAACRKLRAPQLPTLSKPQALVMFVLVALALLLPGRIWDAHLHAATLGSWTLLMLPVMSLLAALATPSFEGWAMALHRQRRPRWLADEAAPYLLVWTMSLAWPLLLWVLYRHQLHDVLEGSQPLALAWVALLLATLPIYLHFASTRYGTPAARGAFIVAVCAHFVMQLIAVCCANESSSTAYVTFCMAPAVLVPLWVAWRQALLRRRVLAPA